VVAAIIGQRQGLAVQHRIDNIPNLGGRLSKTFRTGVVWLSGSHFVVPGNGLFLTSTATGANLGYSYNGVRKWSFGTSLAYNKSKVIS
ncbi:hypothetical protein ACQ7B2_17350, partial [Escherichia coli]